jgi:succinate dehydrogenase, cytochrome b556 subunit
MHSSHTRVLNHKQDWRIDMADIGASNGNGLVNSGVSMAQGHPAETPEQRRARRAAVKKPTNVGLDQLLGHYLPAMAPAAQVSILHRASGMLMFLLGIPFVLYLLSQSLTSEASFAQYSAVVHSWFGKLVLLALIWAFCHHLCAGIRFIILDMHFLTEKPQAMRSALVVLGASLVMTAIFGGMLLFS